MVFKPGQSGNPGGKWKPGQTGNPNGRPKTKIFRDAFLKLLEKQDPELFAAAMMAKAMNGDVAAFKEMVDRVDGKLATPLTGADDGPIKVEAIVTGVVREGDE